MSKDNAKVGRLKTKKKRHKLVDELKETPVALVPINIVAKVTQGSPSRSVVVVLLLRV